MEGVSPPMLQIIRFTLWDLCTSTIYPEGSFCRNQLLCGSISLSPLYLPTTINLHIKIAMVLHQGFPDFNLARYSSPSFRSQDLCSAYTQQCEVDWMSRDCAMQIVPLAKKLIFAFTMRLGLVNAITRIHVKLIGPCFKMCRRGRGSTRQRDENRNRALLAILVLSCTHWPRSQDAQSCRL